MVSVVSRLERNQRVKVDRELRTLRSRNVGRFVTILPLVNVERVVFRTTNISIKYANI